VGKDAHHVVSKIHEVLAAREPAEALELAALGS
jgi:hypothetical protein